jgi:hypothetical protein
MQLCCKFDLVLDTDKLSDDVSDDDLEKLAVLEGEDEPELEIDEVAEELSDIDPVEDPVVLSV